MDHLLSLHSLSFHNHLHVMNLGFTIKCYTYYTVQWFNSWPVKPILLSASINVHRHSMRMSAIMLSLFLSHSVNESGTWRERC